MTRDSLAYWLCIATLPLFDKTAPLGRFSVQADGAYAESC